MRSLTKPLAAFSSAVLVMLASTGPSPAFDVGDAQRDPQATETLDSETGITRLEWKRRVEQSKIRSKQFGLLARAGQLKPMPRSADDIAVEALSTVLNDQGLRPGDIVSTIQGLFIFRGQVGSDPKPGDFAPVPLDILRGN
jgi:hypothetical protein